MPIFNNTEEIVKIYLPSTAHAEEKDRIWVDMDISPLKASDTDKADPNASNIVFGKQMLTNRIKDWNMFTDETETVKLPPTYENINKFSMSDFGYLREQIKEGPGLSEAEKKQ